MDRKGWWEDAGGNGIRPGIPIQSAGSTTLRPAEADARPSARRILLHCQRARRVRGKEPTSRKSTRLPDLAIEVEATNSARPALPLYARSACRRSGDGRGEEMRF